MQQHMQRDIDKYAHDKDGTGQHNRPADLLCPEGDARLFQSREQRKAAMYAMVRLRRSSG